MDENLLHRYEVWEKATLDYLGAEMDWEDAQEEDDVYVEKFEEAKDRIIEIEEELGDDVVVLFNKKFIGEE